MLRRSAKGTKTSRDSLAIFFCLSGGSAESVRRLCKRSASLMISTRTSSPSAIIRRRKLSLVAGRYVSISRIPLRAVESLVTPSTRNATGSPNSLRISSRVRLVSSTVSCNTPAIIVSSSMPHSSRIFFTAKGCTMYGSPVLRNCPSWAFLAISTAFATRSESLLINIL